MLIGTVVDDQIHDDLNAKFVCLGKHFIEIFECTKLRHDIPVITDIVTVVVLWGVKNRAEPDHIDSKILKVRELFNNTLEIAEAVPVGVLKASWINLIYNVILPPIFHFLCLLYFALSRYL